MVPVRLNHSRSQVDLALALPAGAVAVAFCVAAVVSLTAPVEVVNGVLCPLAVA
jgi:hypothetical protein